MSEEKKETRRDFFKKCLRYLLLTGVTAGGCLLIAKHHKFSKTNNDYERYRICKSCTVFSFCVLPESNIARKYEKNNSFKN